MPSPPPLKLHGGKRRGAGRPQGTGSYGEATRLVRVPTSRVGVVIDFLSTYRKRHPSTSLGVETVSAIALDAPRQRIPMIGRRVPAGFPSPADDYLEGRIDLNEHLIKHKEATFILRVKGWSMLKAGIHDGDELIVDRALEPVDGKIVVAVVNGEMTVKRLYKKRGKVRLLAENPEFSPIEFKNGDELNIWGVVTRVIHKV